ncbi:hypothetical protein BH11BAC6_BH11BAC6_08280 [soil metagenome]
MKKIIILFIVCLQIISLLCKAQDSVLVDHLIKRIAALQTTNDNFFLPGIFPSYISNNENFSTKKRDNNIFFNGLIAYTLNDIRPYLKPQEQQEIEATLNNANPVFQKFKNKYRNTYNFWRTDSAYEYPYAGVLKFTRKISLPDDMDDTVLSLLATDADDSTAKAVHALMQQFVNSDSNKVRSMLDVYDRLPAYSTWFGKKFPVVFDVSVLCNILSFVQAYNLEWTSADTASLAVITATIKHNYHISLPVYASPYYPQTSLILYHIARLMSIKEIPELEALKTKLVIDAAKQLAQSDNLLERVILSSAILKWGYMPPNIALPSTAEITNTIEQNDFCFFTGNIPSYFKDVSRFIATKKKIGFFYHYCPAYNDVLLLEYLTLKAQL